MFLEIDALHTSFSCRYLRSFNIWQKLRLPVSNPRSLTGNGILPLIIGALLAFIVIYGISVCIKMHI